MDETRFDGLHVLIADENEQRLDQIATVVLELWHSVRLKADRGLASGRCDQARAA